MGRGKAFTQLYSTYAGLLEISSQDPVKTSGRDGANARLLVDLIGRIKMDNEDVPGSTRNEDLRARNAR
jgi:hypothetical protein